MLVTTYPGPTAASSAELDEVVVTASRRATTVSEVTAAVTVIGLEKLRQGQLATDALANELGVTLQQTTPGQGAAIIRGLKGSAILHLVDGMPLNNAMFRSAPTPYLAYVPVTAIDRLEVVRGTPASLYGSQAVGGVIQVITRRPTFSGDEQQIRRETNIGFNSAETLRSISAALDIGNQRLAASMSGEYREVGNRRTGDGARITPSGYRSKAARIAVSAAPSENDSWFFDLQYLQQPKTPRVDELVAGFGQTEPSSAEFFFQPSNRIFAHLQRDWRPGRNDIDWRLDAAWQRIDDDRTTRDSDSPSRRMESNSSDLFAVSIAASSSNGDRNWVAGVDLQSDTVSSARTAQDIETLITTNVASRFPDGSQIEQAAIFVNSDLFSADRQRLVGGIRVSDVRIDVPQTSSNAAASISIRRLSGDLGWVYDISESLQFVSNLGVGFRAPNVADLGTLGNRPGNRFNIPNTDLGAEEITQFDAGLRHSSERQSLELMAYTLRYNDRISSALTGDTTMDGRDIVQSTNISESRIHGIEAAWRIRPTMRSYVEAVVNYSYGNETTGDVERQPADRVPPLNGRFLVQFDATDHWRWQASITAADRQDRLSDRDIRDSRIDPSGSAGWVAIGTSATWTPGDIWQVDIGLQNVLDNAYRVHGSGIDASGINFSLAIRTIW